MRAAILAALGALAASGCHTVVACDRGTVALTVAVDASVPASSQMVVAIRVGSGTAKTTTLGHGVSSGTLIITFPGGYPAGQTLDVSVTALANGTAVGAGEVSHVLAASCAALALTVKSTAGADLAMGPGGDGGLDGGGDMAGVVNRPDGFVPPSMLNCPVGPGTWQPTGPLPGGGATSLAVDPLAAGVAYVGTLAGGVFKTSNGGMSWTPVNNGIGSTYIQGVAVDRQKAGVIYAVATEGAYRSSDGGAHWTWSPLPGSPGYAGTCVAVSPTNGTVFVCEQGLVKSTDGGMTWSRVGGGLSQSMGVGGVAFDDGNGNAVYAATSLGIYKSADGGSTWAAATTGISPPGTLSVAVQPGNGMNLYAGTNSGVYRSTDGATSWTAVNPPASSQYVSLVIVPGAKPRVYAANMFMGLYYSDDNGATWMHPASLTAPLAAIATVPGATKLYAAASDSGATASGVYTSSDGMIWTSSNTGLTALQINDIAVRRDLVTHPNTYVATDVGIFSSANDGTSWALVDPGHADNVALDPADSTIVFHWGFNSSLYRSGDAGMTWPRVNSVTSMDSLAIDPADDRNVYAGTTSGVAVSGDKGLTFAKPGNTLSTSDIRALAADPSTSGVVWAATTRTIYKSTDKGANWNASNTFNEVIYGITIDPTSSSKLYVALTNGKVARSVDGGTSWADASAGLEPRYVVWRVVVDPQMPSTLYAATADKVYKSTDGAKSWTAVAPCLPPYVYTLGIDPLYPTTIYVGAVGGVFKSTSGGM